MLILGIVSVFLVALGVGLVLGDSLSNASIQKNARHVYIHHVKK